MKNIIFLSCIFGSHAFFVISALIGYSYKGSSNSKAYIIFTLLVAFASMSMIIYDFFTKDRKINIMVISFPLIVTILYLSTIFYGNIDNLARTFYLYFIIWSMPGLFTGMYFSWNHRYEYLFKLLDLVMILTSLAVIISTVLEVIQGNFNGGLAGATNQSLSYISAFALGLNLFLNFIDLNIKRFKFVETKLYNIFSSVLIPLQFLSVIISGGRGGMVLTIVYIILFFLKIISKKVKKKNRGLLIITIAVTFLLLVNSFSNKIINNGLTRAFAYISNDGINWDGTSNRENVYEQAFILIKEKPIFGYGLYGYLSYYENPHNIILEVLLNGGVVYLLIFSLLFIFIFKKYLKMVKLNQNMQVIGIIALLPLVMLMFSGTYMVSSEFWFIIGFILSYKVKKDEKLCFNNNINEEFTLP